MLKNFLVVSVILGLIIFPINSSFATTTQVDALIEKLVEKKILTRAEGIKLKGEIASDAKAIQEESLKTNLPEWVQKLKLKGDFRLRYQYERKHGDTDARIRGRIRYRLGLETEIVKNVIVGAGLASGANDPRSTNQTFTDTFARSDVRLDYAFAQWQAIKDEINNVSVIGGVYQFKDYLWTASDILWDTDITTQGASVHADHKINDNWTAYGNTGVWIVDEISSTTSDKVDPFMNYYQAGLKYKKNQFSTNVAGVYYGFNGLKSSCPDWSAATNTGITSASSGSCTGALKFDYDSIGASAEVAYQKPFSLPLEEVAVFGDYIANIDGLNHGKSNNLDHPFGYALGARVGDPKVNGKNEWQLKYIFAHLEKDAWPDFLPDSDRLGGRTDVRSHEGILEFGINKNITIALDYYQSRRIKGTSALEHVIQADFNFKF